MKSSLWSLKSLEGLEAYWDFQLHEPPNSINPQLVHCKGGTPAGLASPPAYEPPPALTPPPAAPEPKPSVAEEEEQKKLAAKKEEIARKKKGRGATILTGLLTEEPVTAKPVLKDKLGA